MTVRVLHALPFLSSRIPLNAPPPVHGCISDRNRSAGQLQLSAHVPTLILVPLALIAPACSKAPEAVAESGSAAEVAREGVGAQPSSQDPDWRDERKHRALLGLSYESGRAVPVAEELREVLAGLDAADLPRLITEGREALGENRTLAAIALFTRAALLTPEDPERYVELGRSLHASTLEHHASAAYRTGLELAPDHAELTFRVGDAAWRRGEFAEALALFGRAVRLDPDHSRAWGRLARAHFFAERDDAAWHAVHRAEELGEPIPPQLRDRLTARTPEPVR